VLVLVLVPLGARAQTTVLEPFALTGEVRIGDRAGLREPSGLDIVATGTTPSGLVRSAAVLVPGAPARWLLQLVRVVGGGPIFFGFAGETNPLPAVRFQQDTRTYAEAITSITSPAVGDAVRDIDLSGLCSVPMRVIGSLGRNLTGLELRATAVDGSSYGRFAAMTEAPPDTSVTAAAGYVLGTSGALPTIQGELLLRGGNTYRLSGTVRVDSTDLGFVDEVPHLLRAATCRFATEGDEEGGGGGGGGPAFSFSVPDATIGGRIFLRTEPTDERAPVVYGAMTRLLFPNGDQHLAWDGWPGADGGVPFGGLVAQGTWLIRPTAQLGWPDGGRQALTLPSAALPFWSPRLTFPDASSAPFGVYPDASVVADGLHAFSAAYDAPLGYVDGAFSVTGCAQVSDIATVEATFEGLGVGSETFVDARQAERRIPLPTEGGLATTSTRGQLGRYDVALTPGDWRQKRLQLEARPPLSEDAGSFVDLLFEGQAPLSIAPGRAAARPVATALALGAVTVRLAVRNGDGTFRPFRRATASIEGRPAIDLDGTRLGTYRSFAAGTETSALTHTVRLVAPPGPVTVLASALVPANPDGSGPESPTAFPPIVNVPIRAPRADGSCAAICADTVEGVYWNDDERGPAITIDAHESVVRDDHLVISGSARDEAPVESVSLNGAELPLSGIRSDTSRRFTADIPLARGTNTLVFEARDRCRGLGRKLVTIERLRNQAPVFQVTETIGVSEGFPAAATLVAVDPEGAVPTYELDAAAVALGASLDRETGAFAWTPNFAQAGRYSFIVFASDGEDVASTELVVEVAEVNRDPFFVSVDGKPVDGTGADVYLREAEACRFVVEARDPDGDRVTYSLRGLPGRAPPPVELVLDPDTGLATWTPGYEDGGELELELTVLDSRGGRSSVLLRLHVANANRAPIVEGSFTFSVREGEALVFPVRARDPDGTPLRWFLEESSPDGSPALDPATGVFSWLPGFDRAGRWVFLVVVSDGEARARAPVEVVVVDVNRPPRVRFIDGRPPGLDGHVVMGRELEPLVVDVVADDPDGDPVTLQLLAESGNTLPGGLAVGAGGMPEWRPGYEDGGRHEVTLEARDPLGATDLVRLVLVIEERNRSPRPAFPEVGVAREGERFTLPLEGGDPDGDALAYFLRPAPGFAFPAGLELVDGEAPQLAWTPPFDAAGTWGVDVVVDDGHGGSAAAVLLIVVENVNRAPVVVAPGPVRSRGFGGAVVVDVSDPDGDVVTCVAERLPPGVRWDDATRTLSWPDGLGDGPATARLTCADRADSSTAEVVFDVDWGELTGGCGCDAGSTSSLALLLALARLARRRRRR
jgi:hypothetical protein